jgi:hypothetical protein
VGKCPIMEYPQNQVTVWAQDSKSKPSRTREV